MTTWTTVPAGSGGDSRMNMPNGEMSCETARTLEPDVMSSTGKFIVTRLFRRRTILHTAFHSDAPNIVRGAPGHC